jgi:hypothetical protein
MAADSLHVCRDRTADMAAKEPPLAYFAASPSGTRHCICRPSSPDQE